jgi:phosphonate ABC transporter permease subunit PhnE
MKNNKSNRIKWIVGGLIVFFVYAYGVQVTKVDFTEFRKASRQTSRERIMRQLASPDIFDFKVEEFIAAVPIWMPCSPDAPPLPEVDTNGPYLVIDPTCGSYKDYIDVKGFNFEPGTQGPVSFVPSTDKTHNVALRSVNVRAGPDGTFELKFQLPQRENPEEYQLIRATLRRNIGLPSFSENAKNTWEKIVETVFVALLATTLGTFLAIPISFLAARNLMKDIKSPLTGIVFNLLGWPIGIAIGFLLALYIGKLSGFLSSNLFLHLGVLILVPLITWGLARIALPPMEEEEEEEEDKREPVIQHLSQAFKRLLQLLMGLLVVLEIYLLAHLALYLGPLVEDALDLVGYLGNFVFQLGDTVNLVLSVAVALGGGALVGSSLGRIGQNISETMPEASVKIINAIFTALVGALILIALGAVVEWLYTIGHPIQTYYIPGAIGGALGLVLALMVKAKTPLPMGFTLYYITRTILNTIRSIEPLVMVIVAVIWVGIGPFAGMLALTLHTVASLAKLYSEQVESISPGPIEAVEATGANRLQTIVYAVIPQIIPPYISFTMYRWDINVRMSTIIGFAGGGGIGSLLFQNLGLSAYQAVSLQMIAIAVVVATMDYVSSTLRERFV